MLKKLKQIVEEIKRAVNKQVISKIKGVNAGVKAKAEDLGDTEQNNEDLENSNDSRKVLRKQVILFSMVVLALLVSVVLIRSYMNFMNKEDSVDTGQEGKPYVIDYDKADIQLPDKAIDNDQVWRGLHAEQRIADKISLTQQIEELRRSQEEMITETRNNLAINLQQINRATESKMQEIERAKSEIKEMLEQQQEMVNGGSNAMPVEIGETDFSGELVFDEPKPSSEYIPEGSFLSGNLLVGIVASTAMSAPENPTPVVIKLTGRGDLDKRIWKRGKDCRITASCYGEASSERVMVRLERLTCKVGKNWVHTDIFGYVAGSDGKPGIKGTLISIGQKHLKNAALGGFISGISSAAKGEQGLAVSSGGLLSTKSQTGMDILKQGGFHGVSNVGEKLADYALKRADSLSDVLVVPAGVKVNPMIMRGVYFGQVKTRKAVERVRQEQMSLQKTNSQQNRNNNISN
ncbi:MAG: hypothetical protein GY694_00410 [Gammaproteobacteria bacterium]|nr:hypothetical protein [Gammaproteobacteria bacterium]